MNKFILIPIALMFAAPLYSQKNNKYKDNTTYTYNIMQNEPENLENFAILLELVNCDIHSPNLNGGFGMGAYYKYNNLYSIKLSYNCGILDRGDEPHMDDDWAMINYMKGSSFYKSTPKTSFEIIGGYCFSGKIKEKENKVHLKKSGHVEYYGLVPANIYDQFSFRGGFYTYNSYFASQPITGGNGVPINGYLEGDSSKTIASINGGSMYSAGTMVLGISKVRNVDLKVNVEGLGERSSRGYTETYFDILFAPKITIQDMIVAKKGYYDNDGNIINESGNNSMNDYLPFYYRYVVDENTSKSKMGLRIGYTDMSFIKKAPFFYGAEIGSKPGVGSFVTNFYIMIKAGILFRAKI